MRTVEQIEEDATREATYRAIGRFIHQFASVGWALRYHLAEAVKLNPIHMDTVITHNFALLCPAADTIFSEKLKRDEDKKLLKKLISQCRTMNNTMMGVKFLEVWEMQALKHFFSKVRNPIGHGPGAAPMPSLTDRADNPDSADNPGEWDFTEARDPAEVVDAAQRRHIPKHGTPPKPAASIRSKWLMSEITPEPDLSRAARSGRE
ncbi:hypothetical protein [Bradyrhizobium cosmicum]|uniref:hypothetical protein n=1 Tax=Bradyrhizobium cosmicum TaxID=1404864 RepID=UPI0028E91DE7|nr:hypothetical protein [Bradyrhizobium cosmicum]